RFGCAARQVRARFPIVVVGLQDNLIPGSARVSRVGFGVSPKRTLVLLSGERGLLARSCRQLPATPVRAQGSVESCNGFGKLPKLTGWQPVPPRKCATRQRSVSGARRLAALNILCRKVRAASALSL